ncbi:MAG TPA: LPS export ABC transporter permease LptF [Alphaproteobacteria bacterium]|nr:LPS export ABC transporter permease LptF [Alphaproteobacteria bacterium]
MNRISRYLFRHLLIATAIASVVLTFAIWLTQSLRLIEVIVDGQAPIWIFLQMVGLSLPKFLVVVVPVAMVGAVLFTYNRMLGDSELVVMRAAGMSPARLAAPAFALAVLVAALSYALNLVIAPVANQQFRNLSQLIQAEYSTVFLREGQFTTVADGITVYIRERERNGEVSGILVHDNRDPANPVTLVAEQGIVQQAELGPQVVMFDGNRQEANRNAGRVNVLYFDQYTIDLNALEPQTATSTRSEPRERFLSELLNPDMSDPHEARIAKELISMAHERLSAPLMPLGFAAIAMAALLAGEFNRRGQSRRLIAGIAAVVVLQAAEIGVSNATQERTELIPLLYLLPLCAVAIGLVIMYKRPRRPRPGRLQTASAA